MQNEKKFYLWSGRRKRRIEIKTVPALSYNKITTSILYKKAQTYLQCMDRYYEDAGQVMAIGDQENDLTMLAWAWVGVAMGNVPRHVKQAADFVTKSNVEDGVAWALAKLFRCFIRFFTFSVRALCFGSINDILIVLLQTKETM